MSSMEGEPLNLSNSRRIRVSITKPVVREWSPDRLWSIFLRRSSEELPRRFGFSAGGMRPSPSNGWLEEVNVVIAEAEDLLKDGYHAYEHPSDVRQIGRQSYSLLQHTREHIDIITLLLAGDFVEGASFGYSLDDLDSSSSPFEANGGFNGPESCDTMDPAKVISVSNGPDESGVTSARAMRQCNEYGKIGLIDTTVLYSVAGGDGVCLAANGLAGELPQDALYGVLYVNSPSY
ncbi:hypothetical protein BD410DRAFT_842960 [Rickenella mellea]|uniref:Uncharacterized protein n=1 Tax=Rickenella mellea TaxID=50990 RepID=A0A4Y7PU14_9AGAM|nr:hypothetical protein BD410DRAFT_842960 [Rickenella mellea]